jgi:hypothetical protein
MKPNSTTHPTYMRTLLGCALLAFSAALGALALQAGSSQARGGLREAPATATPTLARTAGAETLNELLSMRITSAKGKKVSARGSSSGSVVGPVSFNLVLSSASRASVEFYGTTSGGTLGGTGTASYRVAGPISYFTGTVTGTHGSGKYAHVYSQGITFSGTVNRKTYEVTVRMRGKWHA